MTLLIHPIPAFDDNYIWLLHDDVSGQTAAIDPGDATPVLAELERRKWPLNWILNTHHHWDHINGNAELKAKTGCKITSSAYDQHRIPGVDIALNDGDVFAFGNHRAKILFTPGHTKGHISYWFEDDRALFCGDTLFIMGCGRLLEGDAPTLHASLSRLAKLPPDTRVFCTHEYTLSNARFARAVEPENAALLSRITYMETLRAAGKPTVPGLLRDELETNPFLRAASLEAFTQLRLRKDTFR